MLEGVAKSLARGRAGGSFGMGGGPQSTAHELVEPIPAAPTAHLRVDHRVAEGLEGA